MDVVVIDSARWVSSVVVVGQEGRSLMYYGGILVTILVILLIVYLIRRI